MANQGLASTPGGDGARPAGEAAPPRRWVWKLVVVLGGAGAIVPLMWGVFATGWSSYLGNQAQRQGQFDEAAAHFRDAVRMRPQNAMLWMKLASAQESAGRHVQAAESYEKAAALDAGIKETVGPTIALDYWEAAAQAFQREDNDKALALSEAAVRWDPDNGKMWYNVGIAQQRLHHYRAALADYEKAMAADPNQREALAAATGSLYRFRASIAARNGDCARALSLLDQSDNYVPDDKNSRRLREWVAQWYWREPGGQDVP